MDYQKIYNQIIERAKNENRIKGEETYYEAHHILPLCLGGEGKTKNHKHHNIILLTAKEHLLCHILLCEIYPNEYKLKQALWLMVINKNKKLYNRYKISLKLYERIKTENNLILKEIIPNKKTNHECYKNPERGKKISNSLKGYKQNKEHLCKRKISNSKPISQYDLKGNFIKEWISATEAALFLKGNSNNIQNNCKNRCKTAYGFIWKYKINYNKICLK
jgi:hypothetical protein